MYLNKKYLSSYISKYGFQYTKHITEKTTTFQYFQLIDLKDNKLNNCNFPENKSKTSCKHF